MPQPKKSASSTSAKQRTPAKKRSTAARQEPDTSSVAAIREALNRNVVVTGERLQETVDEAVRRGRMTRADAEDLVQSLMQAGRRQTQDLLSELDVLLERGRSTARRAPGGDRAMAQVDRARRAAGVGGTFPIGGYDDLTAAQITDRLGALSAPELRKVRDHERRNANRKSVLGAIERKLD